MNTGMKLVVVGILAVLVAGALVLKQRRAEGFAGAEALLAVQILEPGVYCVMHNKVLRFPGVSKDYEEGTFVGGALETAG